MHSRNARVYSVCAAGLGGCGFFFFVHVCGHRARTKKACDEYVEQM